jgi:hypothetical protein
MSGRVPASIRVRRHRAILQLAASSSMLSPRFSRSSRTTRPSLANAKSVSLRVVSALMQARSFRFGEPMPSGHAATAHNAAGASR